MKLFGPAIRWRINRFFKLFGHIPAFFIRCFCPVKKGRVMCSAYFFKQYACNPRYLTEYLLDNYPDFEIYWVFKRSVDIKGIDKRVKCIRRYSWKQIVVANTAEYIVSNNRIDPFRLYWCKREGQKYMMLWHGGVALKKIEKDAEDKLSYKYLQTAKYDSKACDLMISGCDFQTRLLKEKFWYDGEILEKGIPRNDIFFKTELHGEMRKKICGRYNIPEGNSIVLYAPTFRKNRSIDPYRIDWNNVIPALRKTSGNKEVTVLLRLHPNLIGSVDVTPLLNNPAVIDVTLYHDMQELLCISDILITDYSSSMFDFTMQWRPCFLYATDIEQYDRGYYFDFRDLPYPVATDEASLIDIIENFDKDKYNEDLKQFFNERVGLFEDGNASRSLAEWMLSHSIEQ
ncbi:MAG: glycerophosphotransferase [Bacteroidales bacterium]|nr:glycerophosphotransferase [Bacteroidales bacterium]